MKDMTTLTCPNLAPHEGHDITYRWDGPTSRTYRCPGRMPTPMSNEVDHLRARGALTALGCDRYVIHHYPNQPDGQHWLATVNEGHQLAHTGHWAATPHAALDGAIKAAEDVAEARRTAP